MLKGVTSFQDSLPVTTRPEGPPTFSIVPRVPVTGSDPTSR